MAIARACALNSVYIAMNKSIKASVMLYTGGNIAEEKALLDSGATENLINPRLVKRHGLPTTKLKKGRKLFNVDGTPNLQGEVTEVVALTVMCGLRVLCEQLFLELLLTTCRASEYTLDLESCLGTLRQG
jgi:hypothetical protein